MRRRLTCPAETRRRFRNHSQAASTRRRSSDRMNTHEVTTDVPALARLQRWALVAGFWGLLAGIIGAFLNIDQFLRSWLIGFLFCLGLTMGSLAMLMMQHMSGGQWGLVTRRVF